MGTFIGSNYFKYYAINVQNFIAVFNVAASNRECNWSFYLDCFLYNGITMAPFKNGHTALLCRTQFPSLGTIDIFELDDYLLWVVLYIVGYLTASLVFTYQRPVKYPISVTTKNVSTLPDVSSLPDVAWRAKSVLVENHCYREVLNMLQRTR